jgi:hypothetical protein
MQQSTNNPGPGELADKKIEIPIAGITHHTRAHSDFALAKNPHASATGVWGELDMAYTQPNPAVCLLACIAVPSHPP